MKRIFMVAGEASGDLLGAELLQDLHARIPQLEASGVGGPRMIGTGFTSFHDAHDLSLIGLAEVIRHLPHVLGILNDLTRRLRENPPDLLITIDLPDFNFALAKRARKLGIRVVHYVSPQVWAWRSGRVWKVAKLVNHLLTLFPFEKQLYAATGLPVTFVGHPLVERARPSRSRAEVRASLGVGVGEKLVVLLPGSRRGEISRLLGVMVESCRILERRGGVRFALAQAETVTEAQLREHWPAGEGPEIALRRGETYDLLAAADAALVASGTATLETALLGAPMVVVYKVSPVTYWIGRRVVRVPFFALANLVAGEGLVPERLQEEVTPQQLVADLTRLLEDGEGVARMRAGYDRIREELSHPAQKAADVVVELLYCEK